MDKKEKTPEQIKKDQIKAKKDALFAKSFNPKAFVGVKKDDFRKMYAGKVAHDLNDVWDWILENRK